MATLDTATVPESTPEETGPPMPSVPVTAKDDRFYQVAEQTWVLVREGETVPRRLHGLPHYRAGEVDGYLERSGKARK